MRVKISEHLGNSGKDSDPTIPIPLKITPVSDMYNIEFIKEENTDLHSPGAFIHTISYITAASRAYLSRLEVQAGVKNTYYMDTDSLVVSAAGFKALHAYVDDTELGKLKLEHTGIIGFHAMSPKSYIIFKEGQTEPIVKMKGFKQDMHDDSNLKFYMNILEKGEGLAN